MRSILFGFFACSLLLIPLVIYGNFSPRFSVAYSASGEVRTENFSQKHNKFQATWRLWIVEIFVSTLAIYLVLSHAYYCFKKGFPNSVPSKCRIFCGEFFG
jgi:hypothetical protein